MLRASAEITVIVTVAVVLFSLNAETKRNHNFTLQEMWCFPSQEVLKTFFFFFFPSSSSTRQVGFKPKMPLPSSGAC